MNRLVTLLSFAAALVLIALPALAATPQPDAVPLFVDGSCATSSPAVDLPVQADFEMLFVDQLSEIPQPQRAAGCFCSGCDAAGNCQCYGGDAACCYNCCIGSGTC